MSGKDQARSEQVLMRVIENRTPCCNHKLIKITRIMKCPVGKSIRVDLRPLPIKILSMAPMKRKLSFMKASKSII